MRAKVLYAIQGTGNGHVARARSLYPKLLEQFDVDLALVGKNSEVELPVEPVWKGRGVTMEYAGNGKVSILKTLFANSIFRIRKEINSIPVAEYDFVINDFESISLRAAKKHNIPVIGVSHQAAVAHSSSPKTKRFMPFGKAVMTRYAPVQDQIGFHFEPYAPEILPPLLGDAILHSEYKPGEEVVVYTPAYSIHQLRKVLSVLPYDFKVFHKCGGGLAKERNIEWNSIDGDTFQNALLSAKAVICGAGFELPSECLYLNIPFVAIPIGGQYEQLCNAKALADLGVPTIDKLGVNDLYDAIQNALRGQQNSVNFTDVRDRVIERINLWWGIMRK